MRRYGRLLWAIARSCGLDAAAADDAVQIAWTELYRSMERLNDVDAVRAWLTTTVRRRAIRASVRQRRVVALVGREADPEPIEEQVLTAERVRAVRTAMQLLCPSDQQLLGLLFSDEAPSYGDIAIASGRPIGSIGPTRGRALRRLASALGEAA
jgi:RNA polymerase sigma factor (sigma-70 family)